MDHHVLEELDIQLKYFKSIVKYLDNSGNLDLIQAQASKFNKEKVLSDIFKPGTMIHCPFSNLLISWKW